MCAHCAQADPQVKLLEILQDNQRFIFENVLLSENPDFTTKK